MAVGVEISSHDYQKTVLKGIPEDLARYTSSALTLVRVFGSVLSTDTLIGLICEEADRLKNQQAKSNQNKSGKNSQSAGDEALAPTGSEGNKRCRKGKCHNCSKPGHWARECQSPKKEEKPGEEAPKPDKPEKPAKAKTKPVSLVNIVEYLDEDEDPILEEIDMCNISLIDNTD